MPMLGYLGEGHAAAEAGHVGVFGNFASFIQRHPAPVGHRLRNALDVAIQQFDLHPADVCA
ncbi:hypothetical protein D3C72_2396230 [compost metagenome]